jgi:hypothetical protein
MHCRPNLCENQEGRGLQLIISGERLSPFSFHLRRKRLHARHLKDREYRPGSIGQASLAGENDITKPASDDYLPPVDFNCSINITGKGLLYGDHADILARLWRRPVPV